MNKNCSILKGLHSLLLIFSPNCYRFRAIDNLVTPSVKLTNDSVVHKNSLNSYLAGSSWSESSARSLLQEVDEDRSQDDQLPPFRGRAQTDGHLFSRFVI